MGKGGGGGVVGYKYSLKMLMGLCRGPVDEIVAIRIGDLLAWAGSVKGGGSFQIDKPNLFGGDQKEGGVKGTVTTMFGYDTQDLAGTEVRNTVLKSTVATTIADGTTVTKTVNGVVTEVAPVVTETVNFMSSLRGVVTMFYNGIICSNSPYPKAWKVRVRRALSGWHGGTAWYPVEAVVTLHDTNGNIIRAMNPAHILYECLTNPVWGRGLSAAGLNEASFIYGANTFCAEGFGLCMAWSRAATLADFMQTVVNHAGAALYTDRATGQVTLKLIRQDYVAANLPVFDYTSGLLSVIDDTQTAPDNSHSEIVVKWVDPVTNLARQTRVQNLAGTQANQTVVSTSVDYPGLPTAGLAARVAQRDLTMQASGIKRFSLVFDRRGRKLTPAAVFKLTIPDRDIFEMVMRVGTIEEGPVGDRTIKVVAVQDVFGLDATTYHSEPENGWTAPDRTARPATLRQVGEANYRDLVLNMRAADLALVTADQGAISTVAARPTTMSTSYEVMTATVGADYVDGGTADWTPNATVSPDLGLYDTSIVITDADGLDQLGTLPVEAWIGDEIVEVTSYNSATGTMVIGRGCVDTIPATHVAGGVIWFPESAQGTDRREYTTGEVVRVKLRTKTNASILETADAPVDTVTIAGRQGRPYAPGNFKIGGVRYGDVSFQPGDLVLTWAHRDRVGQADFILVHGDASTGPEVGVTYTTRVYTSAGVLLRTTTDIVGTTWTYTEAMAAADGAGGFLTVELEAVRDGIASFQHYHWTVRRLVLGYGVAYGLAYGSGSNLAAEPAAGSVEIAGFAPASNVSSDVPAGSIGVTGFAPS